VHTVDVLTVSYLEFNVPFQHKYGYIRDEDVLTVKGGSAMTIGDVFRMFLIKSMQHLSEKTIFGFPVSLGSAEASVR